MICSFHEGKGSYKYNLNIYIFLKFEDKAQHLLRLQDERRHDVQLFAMWKGFMLQADFTRLLDSYASVKQLYPQRIRSNNGL